MKLDLMEQNGHGIPIIIKEYGKQAFEIENNFITVTIPFDKTGYENVHQKNDLDIIVDLIKKNENVTLKEMATKIGKSVKTVQRIINGYEKIIFVGSSKSGHWEIKE